MPTIHEPVLLTEILELLQPRANENFIDCTFGGGGHSLAILNRVKPDGKVVGIDWDFKAAQDSHNKNLIIVNDNYRNLKKIYEVCEKKLGLGEISGILLDLGLSSDQLADDDRGFSFEATGQLDMRFDVNSDHPTAAEILTTYSEKQLEGIFRDYGEEPLAKPIAKLSPRDIELKALGDIGSGVARPRQGRDLHGMLANEGGLPEFFFYGFFKIHHLK